MDNITLLETLKQEYINTEVTVAELARRYKGRRGFSYSTLSKKLRGLKKMTPFHISVRRAYAIGTQGEGIKSSELSLILKEEYGTYTDVRGRRFSKASTKEYMRVYKACLAKAHDESKSFFIAPEWAKGNEDLDGTVDAFIEARPEVARKAYKTVKKHLRKRGIRLPRRQVNAMVKDCIKSTFHNFSRSGASRIFSNLKDSLITLSINRTRTTLTERLESWFEGITY